MIQCGCRERRVGERVVAKIGVGIARTSNAKFAVVGVEDGATLVGVGGRTIMSRIVGVHQIVLPNLSVEIHIEDEHAAAWQFSVPSLLLTVFQQIILVRVGFVANHVDLRHVFERLHGLDGDVLGQFHWLHPSTGKLVETAEARRAETIAIVATPVHERPAAHAEISLIRNVIHVGQAKAVRELMADGADAVDGVVDALVGHGVCVDECAIQLQHLAEIAFLQVPFMGPNGGRIASAGLSPPGIDAHHLVYLAVAIPVIVVEVHQAVHGLTCRSHHLARAGIVASFIASVLTVVLVIFGHLNRTHHIEDEVELAITLLLEIVVDRATETALAISCLVADAGIAQRVVGGQELLVGKLHQDDEPFLLTLIVHKVANGIVACSALLTIDGSLTTAQRGLPHGVNVGQHKPPILLHQISSVFRKPVVQVLVAHQLSFHLHAIQQKRLPNTGFGRNCRGTNGYQQQRPKCKESLHHHIHL